MLSNQRVWSLPLRAQTTWARLNYRERLSNWLQRDFNSYKLNTDLTYNTGSRGQLHFEVRTLSQMSFGSWVTV